MAELWVNRYHYNRRWLDIAPENSYRESLLTPFSGGLSNNNSSEGFTLFYWHRHGLQVNKVNRRDGVASSSQIFSWADIGEEGPLYGAWDNNDNIWLYGETVGLMLLEFDGDKHWEQAEYVDETQIPYALRRVLETQ